MSDSAVIGLAPARDELRLGWPVILACFGTALFAWGFGFYGQGVYLAELQRTRGWSASLIGGATTCFYLAGAALMTQLHRAMARLGPRVVLAGGTILLGLGVVALCRSITPWQLYASNLLMAAGWATTTSTAIATTLAYFFDRRRGLAISLALNGASAGGFTVAPALVQLSHHFGLSRAAPLLGLAMLLVILPLILLGVARPVAPHAKTRPTDVPIGPLLRDRRFQSLAAAFALALMAQVGFLVHQVAFLMPQLGAGRTGTAVACTSFAAMAGRIGLGLVIDRLDQRRAAALSVVSQAGALAAMLALPTHPFALYAACIVFGLSVGNLITLPALIVQREFPAPSFASVIGLSTAIGQCTFAFGPALLGIARDATGGYGAALALCIILQLAAAVIVLLGNRPVPAM